MASINKVILVGNLGANPEVRVAPNGSQVTTMRLATTERWIDKSSGEKREETEWHRVVLFGRLAEIASQYLTKGASVYIEGRLRTRKWQTQDGQDRYGTEIVADEMQMLSRREQSNATPQPAKPYSLPSRLPAAAVLESAWDDTIPF